MWSGMNWWGVECSMSEVLMWLALGSPWGIGEAHFWHIWEGHGGMTLGLDINQALFLWHCYSILFPGCHELSIFAPPCPSAVVFLPLHQLTMNCESWLIQRRSACILSNWADKYIMAHTKQKRRVFGKKWRGVNGWPCNFFCQPFIMKWCHWTMKQGAEELWRTMWMALLE